VAMAALVGYGIVAMAALGYGGPWLWRAVTAGQTVPYLNQCVSIKFVTTHPRWTVVQSKVPKSK